MISVQDARDVRYFAPSFDQHYCGLAHCFSCLRAAVVFAENLLPSRAVAKRYKANIGKEPLAWRHVRFPRVRQPKAGKPFAARILPTV